MKTINVPAHKPGPKYHRRTSRTASALTLALLALACCLSYSASKASADEGQSGKDTTRHKPAAPAKEQAKDGSKSKDSQKRPEEIVLFVNNVRSAPPEFAADLLLTLVESGKVSELVWKRELLEEAFYLAGQVQQPYKRKYASFIHPIDTRAGFLGYAFELGFDTLSLQCRSVRAMLSIDPKKARSLFADIPGLKLQPSGCEESLVYDLSDYYRTLSAVAQAGFTPAETRRNEPTRFIESYIAAINSPTQVEPAANALLALNPSRDDAEMLAFTFSESLRKMSGDDRSFWFTYRGSAQAIFKLLEACEQKGISPDSLLKAYRAHLVKQMSGSRCADMYQITRRDEAALLDVFAKMRLKSSTDIAAISPDEVKPSKVEGAEKTFEYWQSRKGEDLGMKIKRLRFGGNDKPLGGAERETDEWENEVSSFLKDMAAWRKDAEATEEDYFHQKCHLFNGLLELIPRSKAGLREEVMLRFVTHLNDFDLQRGSRIDWFWQASPLLGRDPSLKRIDNPGTKPTSSGQAQASSNRWETLGITKNLVLYLYLEMEKLTLNSKAQ